MVISGCRWNLISSNMACWEIPELAIEVYSWENHRKSTFLLPVGQFIKCPLRALRKQFFEHESALDYTHTQYTKLYISLHPRISSILPQFRYAIGCKWCPRWPFVPSPWLGFAQGRTRTRLGKPWSAGEFPNRMEVLARKILYNYRGFIGDLIIGFSMSFHF
jgi:hypothetical protein